MNQSSRIKLGKKVSGYYPKGIFDLNSFKVLAESNFQSGYESSHRLYFEYSAIQQLFSHIGWGTPKGTCEDNTKEQGGILLGHVYLDDKFIYGVVKKAVPAITNNRSEVYVEFSHSTWSNILSAIDEINDKVEGEKLQIIGWYHTHPNNLDVFMSGTDKNTQSRHFNTYWHYAVVLNPHKKIWRAFWGKDAIECKGLILSTSECNSDLSISDCTNLQDVDEYDSNSNSNDVMANNKISNYFQKLFNCQKYKK